MSCPECFRGAVHTHAEPTGAIETIHGIKTYVAGGSDASRSKSTIIYFPDAFSLKLVNNKLLADKYASATGCKVIVSLPPTITMISTCRPKLRFSVDAQSPTSFPRYFNAKHILQSTTTNFPPHRSPTSSATAAWIPPSCPKWKPPCSPSPNGASVVSSTKSSPL